jgi:hypothetical protein
VQTTFANVRVQDILGQFGASTKNPNPATANSSACANAALTPGPHTITLNFFFVNGTQAAGTGVATYTLTVATQAPALSGGISIGEEDTILKVTLPDTTDTSIKGYDVYCYASSGGDASPASSTGLADASTLVCPDTSTPVTDSATVTDATSEAGDDGAAEASTGTDASSTSTVDAACTVVSSGSTSSGGNPACPSPLGDGTTTSDGGTFVDEAGVTHTASAPSSPPAQYKCAHVDGTSHEILVRNLINGTNYAVAAASTDIYGNTGPLSPSVCGTPKPITDFWDQYANAGGMSGGDFCALEAVGMPAGASVFGIGLAMAGLALVRRRRRS